MIMEIRHFVHTFPPIIDQNCSVLLLGSVPSVKSTQQEFYYMHPQNRFWKVMSALFATDFLPLSPSLKAELLLQNGVALYDAVYECDIEGSSDLKITNMIPANIPKLIKNSSIRKIFTNGTASYTIITKAYPELIPLTTKLPSTSPANASFSLERLLTFWNAVKEATILSKKNP